MTTATVEREELQEIINTLPDSSIAAVLDFLKSLRVFDTDDGYLPHIPNAETAEAIREGRAGKRERVTIDQIMAELNAGN